MASAELPPSWTHLWVQHTALAREFAHEALTRRDGADAEAAVVVAKRLREHAVELGSRFGGGYVGEQLEAALVALTNEYIGFVAATARPRTEPGRTANDRLVAFERTATAVADALAESARRRHFDMTAYSSENVAATVMRPFVATTLHATTEYALRHYGASLAAHEQTLEHVVGVVGPFFESLVAPASVTKLGVVQLLRSMPE